MAPENTGFVHLHVHTEHSPFDGLTKLNDAVKRVSADGQRALAITDHGTLGGAWRFAGYARKAGIKPIQGIEAYLAIAADWHDEPDRNSPQTVEVARDDDTSGELENDDVKTKKSTKTKSYQHITLLAATEEGWENLTRMANAAADTFFANHPLMDFNLIKAHSAGIIALTGCLGGPVLGPVANGDVPQARRNLERIIDAVGRENVYVEVMEHGIEHETKALPVMAELAAEFGLPMVATNDSHYTRPEDAYAHEAWLATRSISKGSTMLHGDRYKFTGQGYHLRTEAEMRGLRPEEWWQTAVSNSVSVAERCSDVLPLEPPMRLPQFDIPEGFENSRKFYNHLVQEGARRKFGYPLPKPVVDRLTLERDVISRMGFIDYFLILWDVIKWAREQGIRVGPGRGSAAGSLTSYCLDIVQVDPLENNLLFERFLEDGRAGMPDIDVDFEQGRRVEVLQYLAERWGRDRVARIGSFNASKTRRALRDAGKLLEQPRIGDALSKAVPIGEGGAPYPFDKLDDTSDPATARFHEVLAQFGESGQLVVNLARGFADTINGEGIHACGTLIADADLNGLVPLRKDRKADSGAGLTTVTQWDGKDVDAYGLLKLDVLGLRNLDVISKAAKFIQQTTGEIVDPDRLPHPNTKGDRRVDATWALLQSGRTAGIFQMESGGMSNLARQIKPERLADLSAVVALFRPGPLGEGMHLAYADRKAGLQEVSYRQWTDDPIEIAALDSVLGETYGVFVYQEQLMRLGTVVAGFDAKQRSKLRKAVGKKIKAEMEKVGEMLIEGAPTEVRDEKTGEIISPVFSRGTASRLYESMKYSAAYLFNASHSFAYAQLAYITAYLKANWPAQYGAAILATTDGDEKRQAALRALREEGIEILAPDVNRSLAETSPLDENTVLLGLSEIKGVGEAGKRLAQFRTANQTVFTSMHDMATRVLDENGKAEIDTGTLEALIEAGALDQFGPRAGMMRVSRAAKIAALPVPDEEWGILERSTRQRQRLGVIMGDHPIDALQDKILAWRSPTIRADRRGSYGEVPGALSDLPSNDGDSVYVVGILAEWTERAYSKGQMANFTIEDSKVSIRGVLWDQTLKALRVNGLPAVGQIVVVGGKVQVKSRDIEDEEGNVIDTEEFKELMAFTIEVGPTDDGGITTAPPSERLPLRRYVQFAAEYQKDGPDSPTEQPNQVVAALAPVPETVVPRGDGSSVPVIAKWGRRPSGLWHYDQSIDHLAREVRSGRIRLGDEQVDGDNSTAWLLDGKQVVGIFVTIGDPALLPTRGSAAQWWPKTDSVPRWSDLLGQASIADTSQADDFEAAEIASPPSIQTFELEEIEFA